MGPEESSLFGDASTPTQLMHHLDGLRNERAKLLDKLAMTEKELRDAEVAIAKTIDFLETGLGRRNDKAAVL
jgi:hypothetical protein